MFCIPKNLIKKLKESALKGQIDIKKLYEMTSAERRAFFTKHTDANLGKLINTEFEKAMISKQKSAITDWAKGVFTPEAKTKPIYKTVLDKINSLQELGVLTPKTEKAFLQDLVADKLGVNVSPEEIKIINQKAIKVKIAQEKLGQDIGVPAKLQENLDFFGAKKEMDDYLYGLSPASKLRVLTGTIGRGMMLASVKSPILNIGSNTEVGITEALVRRLSSGKIKGTDNALAVDYVKMVNKIYQKTGYDISRMLDIRDTGASGERVLGKDTVHAQGPGKIRAVGRIMEDWVFKQAMGAPDVAFSSAHFADSVNLNSLKMAKGDIVKAKEYMQDAMRLKPQTPEGEVLKAQGVMDAQVATWTNYSWAAKLSEGIRKIVNEVTGDVRLGDWLLPFVKTPANVIETGMDYAGMGIPKAMVEVVGGIRAGDLKERPRIQAITRNLVRSGIGFTAALIIASQLKDDDFVGAYDPSRSQIEQLRNSNYNAIRIGGKWISVDWLGPLGVSVSAIMTARKYGKNGIGEMAFQYAKGVGTQIQNLPGVSDLWDTVKANAYKQNQTLEEMTGETANYLTEQLYSRLTPSFLSDIAKATDTFQRKTTKGWEAVKSKIPGLRQTLPVKTNVFGEQMKAEGGISSVLFGARIKTSTENDMIKEISQVSQDTGKGITFTDWDKSTSKTLAQFKEKKGENKFKEAKLYYGKELKKQIEDTIKKSTYKKLTPDEKLKVINGLDSGAMDKTFKRYNFKYQQEKTKKIVL